MFLDHKKRGDVEIQFNWIFVMVAGALILILFVSIVIKQKEAAKERLASEVIDKLSVILSGAQVTTSSMMFIDIPDLGYTFKCDLDTCTDYACTSRMSAEHVRIQGLSYSVQPVFSPDLIKGSSMSTWTLDWSVPFRVSNFLLVTSPGVRYIIVNSTPNEENSLVRSKLAEQIYLSLPDRIVDTVTGEERLLVSKEFIQHPGLEPGNSGSEALPLPVEDAGNYKVKIVSLSKHSIKIVGSGFNKADIGIIWVDPLGQGLTNYLDGYGSLDFHRNKRDIKAGGSKVFVPEGQSVYFGRALLFAAIFSENYENYGCNLKKALTHLRVVSDVYGHRAAMLSEFFSSQGHINDCARPDVYLRAQKDFSVIKSLASQSAASTDNNDNTWLKQFAEAQSRLSGYNYVLTTYSCPAVY